MCNVPIHPPEFLVSRRGSVVFVIQGDQEVDVPLFKVVVSVTRVIEYEGISSHIHSGVGSCCRTNVGTFPGLILHGSEED